jgi:hypothetical protein
MSTQDAHVIMNVDQLIEIITSLFDMFIYLARHLGDVFPSDSHFIEMPG